MDDCFNNDEDTSREDSGEVSIARWLWLAVVWDGVLPACVLAVPFLTLRLGGDPDQIETVGIMTPVLAFVLRLAIGCVKLGRNHCGPVMKFFQFIVFFCGAFLLICVDGMMILAMEPNNAGMLKNPSDLIVLGSLLAVYFSAMLFAFYPGRSSESA